MRDSHYPLLIALSIMSGCSYEETPNSGHQVREFETFGPDDKRAAQMLSIGRQDKHGNASPQYQAALCSLALASIKDRLREGGLLTGEQQRAFSKAQILYNKRAAKGISEEESEINLTDVEAAYPNDSDRARFAIGCLRDLT